MACMHDVIKNVLTVLVLFVTVMVHSAQARSSDSEVEKAVGMLALESEKPHCTAFAIDSHWIVSALGCVVDSVQSSNNVSYGLEESEYQSRYDFVSTHGKTKRLSISLESYLPEKQVAYFYSQTPLAAYLKQSYETPTKLVSGSSSGTLQWYSLDSLFVVENLFYYIQNLPYLSLGAPLVSRSNAYVGMHLGSARHEGSDYRVGSKHFQDIFYKNHEHLKIIQPVF